MELGQFGGAWYGDEVIAQKVASEKKPGFFKKPGFRHAATAERDASPNDTVCGRLLSIGCARRSPCLTSCAGERTIEPVSGSQEPPAVEPGATGGFHSNPKRQREGKVPQ